MEHLSNLFQKPSLNYENEDNVWVKNTSAFKPDATCEIDEETKQIILENNENIPLAVYVPTRFETEKNLVFTKLYKHNNTTIHAHFYNSNNENIKKIAQTKNDQNGCPLLLDRGPDLSDHVQWETNIHKKGIKRFVIFLYIVFLAAITVLVLTCTLSLHEAEFLIAIPDAFIFTYFIYKVVISLKSDRRIGVIARKMIDCESVTWTTIIAFLFFHLEIFIPTLLVAIPFFAGATCIAALIALSYFRASEKNRRQAKEIISAIKSLHLYTTNQDCNKSEIIPLQEIRKDKTEAPEIDECLISLLNPKYFKMSSRRHDGNQQIPYVEDKYVNVDHIDDLNKLMEEKDPQENDNSSQNYTQCCITKQNQIKREFRKNLDYNKNAKTVSCVKSYRDTTRTIKTWHAAMYFAIIIIAMIAILILRMAIPNITNKCQLWILAAKGCMELITCVAICRTIAPNIKIESDLALMFYCLTFVIAFTNLLDLLLMPKGHGYIIIKGSVEAAFVLGKIIYAQYMEHSSNKYVKNSLYNQLSPATNNGLDRKYNIITTTKPMETAKEIEEKEHKEDNQALEDEIEVNLSDLDERSSHSDNIDTAKKKKIHNINKMVPSRTNNTQISRKSSVAESHYTRSNNNQSQQLQSTKNKNSSAPSRNESYTSSKQTTATTDLMSRKKYGAVQNQCMNYNDFLSNQLSGKKPPIY